MSFSITRVIPIDSDWSAVCAGLPTERDLSWTDQIVASVFDEPADVMLWRGPRGTLDYWALAMSRGSLATVVPGNGDDRHQGSSADAGWRTDHRWDERPDLCP